MVGPGNLVSEKKAELTFISERKFHARAEEKA